MIIGRDVKQNTEGIFQCAVIIYRFEDIELCFTFGHFQGNEFDQYKIAEHVHVHVLIYGAKLLKDNP
jgi:hypothetical protein